MTTTTTTTKWNTTRCERKDTRTSIVHTGWGLGGTRITLRHDRVETSRVRWVLEEWSHANGYPELRKVASGAVAHGGYRYAFEAAEAALAKAGRL